MGLFDFFKKRKKEDVNIDFSLKNLKVGAVFDFDGETWEVESIGEYDYGGSVEKEWKIKSATKEGFLSSDGEHIYFFVKTTLDDFKPEPISYLKSHNDFPQEVEYKNKKYILKYSASAYYIKTFERAPVIIWDFERNGEILEVLQWGEEEFEIFLGREVQEWEIDSILLR